MSTADKIGLLPGFGWFADWSWWAILLVVWAFTPGMMILIGVIGESRWIPLWSDKQFRSFFPGDLFLGAALTGLFVLAQRHLPAAEHWYNSLWWHVIVFVIVLAVAIFMTYSEWDKGDVLDMSRYSTGTILSPTKLYHNFFLYWLYGYMAVTTLVAVVFGGRTWWVIVPLLIGAGWFALVQYDAVGMSKSTEARNLKAANAHIQDWHPIWKTGRITTQYF